MATRSAFQRQRAADMQRYLRRVQRLAYSSQDPSSWSHLAAFYATGVAGRKQLGVARRWYARAAAAAHPTAMFEFGLMLIQGEGGPKDVPHGLKWLERSGMSGHANASLYLARAFSLGLHGLPVNIERAESWRARAIKSGAKPEHVAAATAS